MKLKSVVCENYFTQKTMAVITYPCNIDIIDIYLC